MLGFCSEVGGFEQLISNAHFNCSSKTLALEKPVETAMLTSLTGVKCIIGNQWYCTLAENASKLNTSMTGNLNSVLFYLIVFI